MLEYLKWYRNATYAFLQKSQANTHWKPFIILEVIFILAYVG
jgi:hypothetical protein